MLIIINIHGGISVMHVNRRAALLQGRVSRGRRKPIIISSDLAAAQNMIVSGNLIVYGNLIVSENLIVCGNSSWEDCHLSLRLICRSAQWSILRI